MVQTSEASAVLSVTCREIGSDISSLGDGASQLNQLSALNMGVSKKKGKNPKSSLVFGFNPSEKC